MADHRSWTVTLRIDTSAGSANREYPAMNVLDYGHAWLSVVAPNGHRADIGYYPTGFMLGCPGKLVLEDNRHQATQDAAYTFVVTAAQAERLLDVAEHIRTNPGTYAVTYHNCLTVAHALLVSAGVPVPAMDMRTAPAWVGGQAGPSVLQAHDPARYNTALRASPVGRDARTRYEHSSELSGTRTFGPPAPPDDQGLTNFQRLRGEARSEAADEGTHTSRDAHDSDIHADHDPTHPVDVETVDPGLSDPRLAVSEDEAGSEGGGDAGEEDSAALDDGPGWADDGDSSRSGYAEVPDPGLSQPAAPDLRSDDPGTSHGSDANPDPGLSKLADHDRDPGLSHAQHPDADVPYTPHDFIPHHV